MGEVCCCSTTPEQASIRGTREGLSEVPVASGTRPDERYVAASPGESSNELLLAGGGEEAIQAALASIVEKLDTELDAQRIALKNKGKDDLVGYSILERVPLEHKRMLVRSAQGVSKFDRAMGCICGMAVGDALGHPYEFMPAADVPGPSHFDLKTMTFNQEFNKFQLERGQWTDDASMGLCMADSFIMRRGYCGADMRVRFWCWWYRAYNNAFRRDPDRGRMSSVGLGGNIRKSLEELTGLGGAAVPPLFGASGEDAGNGSLMRLAPLPIFLHGVEDEELYHTARQSSRTTHPGNIAAEACAFLSHLLRKAMALPAGPVDARAFLDREAEEYMRVSGLAEKSGFGWDELNWLVTSSPTRDTDQCWDWRSDTLKVNASLNARGYSYNGYPVSFDYFGAYSLDGLAVALWCVYHTASFDEAVTRSVNFLGDADSHGSITGQLAGALYGYSGINQQFIDWLTQWDEHEFAMHGLLLHHLGAQPLCLH